ncbi:MAG: hypothetical protein IT258_18780, partial [Saprospiraceae bacterium]|nr:hypothetical protein [Saprospiraceae bacterium]
MSADCKEKLNPLRLKRDGAHQGQRLTAALDPTFAKVDEREPAHWMVFARRYARFIHFFDNNNLPTDTWQSFFSNDPAAYLATAAVQNVGHYQIKMQEYLGFLLNLDNEFDAVGLTKNFGNLFNCVGSLAWQLEQMKEALPATVELQIMEGSGSNFSQKSKELALRASLQNSIVTQLAPAFMRLIRYYKGALSLPYSVVDFTEQLDWEILGADVQPFTEILAKGFSKDWIVGAALDWPSFRDSLVGETYVYGDPLPSSTFDQINHAAAHNLFTDILDQFLKAYARTVTEAKQNLEAMLSGWDRHEPHYALFLSFLRLLVFARDHANTLTGRHLDYYYKQILQLREKASEPNEVHLLFELSKHVDSHLLSAGTQLKAGKDSLGNDVFYSLAEDFVANKARVESLKSVFHDYRSQNPNTAPFGDGRLYAAPIANSADGLGGELTNANGQWHPFANKRYNNEKLSEISMPKATMGMAVASHYLYLKEGERTIFLFFKLAAWNLPTGEYSQHFQVELTGEKGWVPVEAKVTGTQSDAFLPQINQTLQFNITLPGDQKSTVPYSPKTHGGNFDT